MAKTSGNPAIGAKGKSGSGPGIGASKIASGMLIGGSGPSKSQPEANTQNPGVKAK